MLYKAYRKLDYEPESEKCLIESDSKQEAFKEYLAFLYEECNYSRNVDMSKDSNIKIEPVNDEILKINMLQNQESVNRIELNL
jgi:hypothetical protein